MILAGVIKIESQNVRENKRFEIKSRPRPGSFNTKAPREPLIAPPPAAGRRNSTTTSACSDLINFNSPSPIDKKNALVDEFTHVAIYSKRCLEERFEQQNAPQQAITYPQLAPPTVPPRGVHLRRSSEDKFTRPLAISDTPSDFNFDVFKLLAKQNNNNLIDLSVVTYQAVPSRISVLEAFDPLLKEIGEAADAAADDAESQCSSIYDVYDPFDYMKTPHVEPVYATVVKKSSPIKEAVSPSRTDGAEPPPLPPRESPASINRKPLIRQRVQQILMPAFCTPRFKFENFYCNNFTRAVKFDLQTYNKIIFSESKN
jgi:hypothetical protein